MKRIICGIIASGYTAAAFYFIWWLAGMEIGSMGSGLFAFFASLFTPLIGMVTYWETVKKW